MLLSDLDIQRSMYQNDISIDPFNPQHMQPASYDLTLAPDYRMPILDIDHIDLANVQAGHTELNSMEEHGMVLMPGDFMIGCSTEYIKIRPTLAGRVEGKSSLGRLGLTIHVTAGFIDPGYQGNITLEIFNAAPWSITLYPGMKIAQLAFMLVHGKVFKPYGEAGNRYQGSIGPVESRYRL